MQQVTYLYILLFNQLWSLSVSEASTTIYVKNCLNASIAYKKPWSRGITFDWTAYTDATPNLDLKWEIYKMSGKHFTNKINIQSEYRGYNFVLQPYSLGAGFYKIIVLSQQAEYKMSSPCYLRIQPEPCFANIIGGSLQEYRPGETIIVNGSISQDYCHPEGENNSLQYSWSCKQNSHGFCPHKIMGSESSYVIPKEHVVEKEEFTVHLTVKNEDQMISKTAQKIVIRPNVIQYQIDCIRNCPPWSRVGMDTQLTVNCTKYCGESCEPSWTIYRNGQLTNKSGDRGACKIKSSCTFYVTEPGTVEFVYNCAGKNANGRGALTINFTVNPKVICKISPTKGISYQTQFQIECQIHSNETIQTIEVYVFENKTVELLKTWSPPMDHKFRLSSKTEKILVRVAVQPGVYSYTTLDVNVAKELSSDSAEDSIKQILYLYKDSGNNSIKHYLENSHDRREGLNMITTLWSEINAMKLDSKEFYEFIFNLKLYTIDDLLMIPVTTNDDLIQMNNAVKNLLLNHNQSDPLIEKSLSMICRKLGSDYEYLTQNRKDLYFQVTVDHLKMTETLAECSTNTINEDQSLLDLLNVKDKKYLTTERQLVVKAITEDYDDYVEFGEEYYTHLEDLEEAGSNILELSSLLTKAIANSVGKSGHKTFISENINISTYRKSGYYFHKKLSVKGVSISPSRDIYRSKDDFSFTLVTWKKNLFWWAGNKFKPSTFVADISFENIDTDKVVSDFKRPNYISLEIVNNVQSVRKEVFSVTVPSTYYKPRMQEEYMDNFINVHRLDIFRHQGVFVQFLNLKGQKFYIVVKNFEVPVMADFKKKSVFLVDENNTYISHVNNNGYDSWYYVGVLPHRDMVKGYGKDQTFRYTISFSAPVCYQFTFDQSWRRSCKGGKSSKTHITCKCHHLSIVAGTVEPVTSRKLELHGIELELKLESHRKIFWCVLLVFSAYCILLLYGKKQRNIYYAADNNYNDRYAYLVVVRTGRFWQLTAHIVIRIIGSNGQTPPHILNYPDPHHRIFQSGSEDWIVVTTAEGLGDIENIELWHDSFGVKPTWYCKDIVIHDIQTQEKWLFKINQTISVCHEYKIRVAPLSTSKPMTKRLRDVLSLSTERHIWNIFADDIHHLTPYIRRLLLLYSKVITLLVITMVWHGLPSIEIHDTVDPFNNYFDWYLLLIAFGSSMISFLVHSIQFWWKSKYTVHFTVPLILASNTVLIIFGFWIPYYSTMRIIIAWLFGILFDIVIYNNLLKMIRKLIYGTKLIDTNRGISYEKVKKEINIQRETLRKICESVFMFKLHQMAVPLKGKKFLHRKMENMRRTQIGQQFKDLVMFSIYIILLHAVVSVEKDHLVFVNQNVVKDTFQGRFTRTENFFKIRHIADMYRYLNTTLIDAMHTPEWYPNYADEGPGLLIDRSNKYIGVVRIRQQRVKYKTSDLDFIPNNTLVGPDFSADDEERRTFEHSWNIPTPYIGVKKRLSSMWVYSYAATAGSMQYGGFFADYPGSGYIITMGRTRHNSLANLNALKDSKWIDRFTRSIFIEFLTYSANYNLFNSVRAVAERSPTGIIRCRLEVSPARMIYVGGELERRSLLIIVIFVIWLIVLFLNKTKFFLREHLSVLKNFWNFLDLTIIIVSICTIIIYVARVRNIGDFLNKMERVKHNEFVNYFDLFYMHTTLNGIGALLICISTIRLWKLMRFFKMFRMFEKTFTLVIRPVLALFLHQVIFIIACTVVAHIVLGENSNDFVTFRKSFNSLGRIYLTLYDNYDFFITHPKMTTLGMVVIVVYIVVSKIFFATYIVICVLGHIDARKFFSQHQEEDYSFVDYLKEEVRFVFRWFRPRIARHRESVVKQVIYPKPDRYLYSNCQSTTTHAMKSMTVVAAIVLHNKLQRSSTEGDLSEKQIELMLRVCQYFLTEHIPVDHKEFFFKLHQGKTIKFIDSNRIDKAKHVVEILLGVSKKIEEQQRMNQQMVLHHHMKYMDKLEKKLRVCLYSLENIEFVQHDE